jgi:23S rRNA pseudouridine2605 synthase
MAQERIHKIIAAAGLCSRRKAEELILAGEVTVNGVLVTELGSKADPVNDKIKVQGKLIMTDNEKLYVVYNKPRGVVCALSDPEGRPSLSHLIARLNQRVVPVGRMDFNSEGLLLLTNDGDMANKLFRARRLPKTYHLKIKGHFRPEELEFLRDGIYTQEGVVRFRKITLDEKLRNKTWLGLQVIEGASLDLREILNHRGLLVDRIVRTKIGDMAMGELAPDDFRLVKKEEFEALLNEGAEKSKEATSEEASAASADAAAPAKTVRRSKRTEIEPAKIFANRRSIRKEGRLNPWQQRRALKASAASGGEAARREESDSEGRRPPRRFGDDRPRRSFGGVSNKPRRRFGSSDRPRRSFGPRG